MRGGARGGAKAEQAVAVTGSTAFTPVAVDGGLQLAGRTQRLPLAFVRIQILHIPETDKPDTRQPVAFILILCTDSAGKSEKCI